MLTSINLHKQKLTGTLIFKNAKGSWDQKVENFPHLDFDLTAYGGQRKDNYPTLSL